MPKIYPKKRFLTFAKKLIHSCFFFYPKIVPKTVLYDSSKSTCLKKNLVLKCSIFWSSMSLERIKWYLSYVSWSWSSSKAASEKAVVWSDVVRFAFHAVRLYDSLIINILGENQVISFFFFMHAVSHQGKVAFESTTFGCVWSDKLLVQLDCRILWPTISLKRIIWLLSFLWSLSSRQGSTGDYCFWLSLARYVDPVKLDCRIFWSSISLEGINLYLCLFFLFIYSHHLSNLAGVHLAITY